MKIGLLRIKWRGKSDYEEKLTKMEEETPDEMEMAEEKVEEGEEKEKAA